MLLQTQRLAPCPGWEALDQCELLYPHQEVRARTYLSVKVMLTLAYVMLTLLIACCTLDPVGRVGRDTLRVSWVPPDDKIISASLHFRASNCSSAGHETTSRHHTTGCHATGSYASSGSTRRCFCSWCFLLRLFIIDNNLGCFRKAEVSSIVVDTFHSTFASVWDNVTLINICS